MLSRILSLITSVLFLAGLALPSHAETIRVTDVLGTVVELSLPAKRIISLAPNITEILFALNLDSEIIGITDVCDFPEQVKEKYRIGRAIYPNVEEILSLKPDLILAVDGVTGSVGIQELLRLGLPVVTLRPRMINLLVEDIHLIGRLTNHEKEAKRLASGILRQVKEIEDKTRDLEPVSVLYLIWHDPMMTVGPDTFIGEIITRAGGRMIGKDLGLGYFRLGMEAVLLFNPEVIIIGDEIGAKNIEVQRQYWKRWSTIRAVRNNRIHFINADLVHRPGPRISEGMAVFAKLLHPEVF